jgi:hypothetical protein
MTNRGLGGLLMVRTTACGARRLANARSVQSVRNSRLSLPPNRARVTQALLRFHQRQQLLSRSLSKAPPLPPATGEVIRVDRTPALFAAAQHVKPCGTILLVSGTYRLNDRRLSVQTDGVCLRSESGNRSDVVLEGDGSGEALAVMSPAKFYF